MEISVYNKNLERIGVSTDFISLYWEEDYNTVGEFTFEAWQGNIDLSLFQEDFFVGKKDSETLMIIKTVSIGGGIATVSGYECKKILYDRVSTKVISNENAEEALRGLVSEMDPFPGIELGNVYGVTDDFLAQKSDSDLLEYCGIISQAVDMGYKLRHDRKQRKLFFECYKPGKNDDIKLSTAFGNMNSLTYAESNANYKNVAVVAGAGEGDARITVVAGDVESTGYDRKEMYVDARNVQLAEGETDEAYKERLRLTGLEKLVDQIKIKSIEFEIDDDRAKLGDIVTCVIPEFAVKLDTRIVGLIWTYSNGKITKQATLGQPVMSGRSR